MRNPCIAQSEIAHGQSTLQSLEVAVNQTTMKTQKTDFARASHDK
jgi:hypothetical protein